MQGYQNSDQRLARGRPPRSGSQPIFSEQVRLLYAHARTGLLVNLAVASMAFWLLWRVVPDRPLRGWFAAVVVITALRAILVVGYHRRSSAARDPGPWCHRFLLGLTLSAAAWAAIVPAVAPYGSLETQLLVTFILGGMASGAIPALASVASAILLYMGITLVPLLVWFALQGDRTHLGIACLVLVYAGALFVIARNYTRRLAGYLQLAFENTDLVQELSAARNAAEESNRKLEARVEEGARVEAQLRASAQRYQALFDASPISLWEEDWSGVKARVDELHRNGVADIARYLETRPEFVDEAMAAVRVLDVNEATLAVFRAPDKATFLDCIVERGRTAAYPGFASELAAFAAGRARVVTQSETQTYAGETINIRTTVEIPREHTATWERVIATVEDITEEQELSRRLSYQATHDALTDLLNRTEFERRLSALLDSAHAHGEQHALCYVDLDQFKVINDTCGHVAGDELLRRIAAILQQQVRKRDAVARLGGDEFGVLLEHCSAREARRVARGLLNAIDAYRFVWNEETFHVGASIGLVSINESSTDITQVMSAADVSCYAAKERGRNRVHVYRYDDKEMARQHGTMEWVGRITRALDEDRFQLHVQPIVPVSCEIESGAHYEVLIRMLDRHGGAIAPAAFLPAAERYHLSAKLDRWVMDTALDWLAAQPSHLAGLGLCSINLSGLSLADDAFLRFVVDKLESGIIPPAKICFEITETAAIANLASATRFIQRLQKLGCRFALDDFGSGLSSFAYLKNLPVDYIKIDGLFVKDIARDPLDLILVKTINEMAHAMGKKTIAEFVESTEVLEKVRELGVDYAQGYRIGRPQPMDTLATAGGLRAALLATPVEEVTRHLRTGARSSV